MIRRIARGRRGLCAVRRGALVVVLAVLSVAGPAGAQGDATPIVGSGSFGTAPRVQSGTTYEDSVRPGEILYYAVPLRAGQSIRASLRLEDENPGDNAVVAFAAYDPLRRFLGDTNAVVSSGAADLTTEPAAAVSSAGTDEASGPGVWYVAVVATTPGQSASRFQLPFTLRVDVTGTAAATPSPSPTPTPTAAPADEDADAGGPSLALVAVVAVVALLLGGAAGVRLRRR